MDRREFVKSFFFLGLGIMGGKVMYPTIPEFKLWQPTKAQIDWGHRNGSTVYKLYGYKLYGGAAGAGKTNLLNYYLTQEVQKLLKSLPDSERLVLEKSNCTIFLKREIK